MIKDIIVIIVLICVLIAIIKLQTFLSKKDNKILGLIIPIFIFVFSLVLALGGTPVEPEIETSQAIVSETGEALEEPLDTNISPTIINKSLALNSIIYTILIINIGNVVMLGIYFYCRHHKKISIELKRMKSKELC